MGSQVQAFKPPSHCKMKPLIILSLVALSWSQYSGETQDLSNSQLDALKDIFGDAAGGGAYSAQQCQTWMNGELSRLNQEVTDMQNAGSLTGRKKAAALAKGIKAQETLNKYSQCNVFWQPIDAAPLTSGGDGYVDGGDVDISNFERDNYPAAPLTDGTDGYSEPKIVDTAPLTDGSYSETKTIDTAPLTDASYSETKTVDAAPLTDGSYSEPKTAPQIDAGAYTEDSADLTGEVKAPGPVY